MSERDKRKPFTFSLPIFFHAELKKWASSTGMSASKFLETAMIPVFAKMREHERLASRYQPDLASPEGQVPFTLSKDQQNFLTKNPGTTAQQMFNMCIKAGIKEFNQSRGAAVEQSYQRQPAQRMPVAKEPQKPILRPPVAIQADPAIDPFS